MKTPRYQKLYKLAQELRSKKAALRYELNRNRQKAETRQMSKSPKINKKSIAMSRSRSPFLQRNQLWRVSNSNKKLLSEMRVSEQRNRSMSKSCTFNPEVHRAPTRKSTHLAKGQKQYMLRQLKAQVKKKEQGFLQQHPYSHIWNSSVRFDTSYDQLNLSLKVSPRTSRYKTRNKGDSEQLLESRLQSGLKQILSNIFQSTVIGEQ